MGVLGVVGKIVSGGVLDSVPKIIDSIKGKNPEDAEKFRELTAKYQEDILAADVAARQAQTDVNKVEAASNSIFVAGWRPFVGWVCGSGLAIQFIIRPITTFIANLCGRPVDFPSLDLGTLLTLLFGMMGLGAMRTYEKINGAGGTNL